MLSGRPDRALVGVTTSPRFDVGGHGDRHGAVTVKQHPIQGGKFPSSAAHHEDEHRTKEAGNRARTHRQNVVRFRAECCWGCAAAE